MAGPFQQKPVWGTRAELDNIRNSRTNPSQPLHVRRLVCICDGTGLCGCLFCVHSVEAEPEGPFPPLSDLLTWLPLVLMDPGLFPSFSSLCQSTAGIKPNELSACTAAPVFVQRTNEQTAVAKTQLLHCCPIGQALGCGPALEFPGPLLLDILASCLNVGWGDLKVWEPSLQLQDQILVHQSPWAQIRDAQPCSLRTGMREEGSCADAACDL